MPISGLNPYAPPYPRFGLGGGPPPPPPPPSSAAPVFGHYFSQFQLGDKPVASDVYTTQWLVPWGESNKWAFCGGWLRDRPLEINPLPVGGDLETELIKIQVQQAMAAALDGFTVDFLNCIPGNYHQRRVVKLGTAAAAVGGGWFKLLAMPDCGVLNGNGSTNQQVADVILGYLSKGCAYKLADGRLVVCPYQAEKWSVTRWNAFLDLLAAQSGLSVAFFPCFLNYTANVAAYKAGIPRMVGASRWGDRNPLQSSSNTVAAADAHSRGLLWMQPVSFQDFRPHLSTYDEAGNTENLRTTWDQAVRGKADMVQIPTWNDYSEEAHVEPSKYRGTNVLDLSAYFMARWKTGAYPAITKDKVYLSHRRQLLATAPVGWTNPNGTHGAETSLMNLRGGSTPGRDTVEVLTLLTAAATAKVTVGGVTTTQAVPAGMNAFTVPLRNGAVSVIISRSGVADLVCASPWNVLTAPEVQDFQYVMVSSTRGGPTSV